MKYLISLSLVLTTVFYGSAGVKGIGPTIKLRPVNIKNVSYSPTGKFFAVPNMITAGSVGIFTVTQTGQIAAVPSRLSERDFSRSAGVFYYHEKKDDSRVMAFLPLPELLSGYSVTFLSKGDTLAVAGGDKVLFFESENWKQVRSVTISQNTTRAVFSPDGSTMAAVADGKIFVLDTRAYSLLYKLDPPRGSLFADVAFSNSGSKIAAFEYKNLLLDYQSRVRIFDSRTGVLDRDLPYFSDKPGTVPGARLPLLSFSPGDSAIAVTIEKTFLGKVLLIKSNDGTLIKQFTGFCHAYSPDGTLFAAGGKIYNTQTWKELGKYGNSAVCVTFSPTERVLVVITPENLKRYRIEE